MQFGGNSVQIQSDNIQIAGLIQHAASDDVFDLAENRMTLIIQQIHTCHLQRSACLIKTTNDGFGKQPFLLCQLV